MTFNHKQRYKNKVMEKKRQEKKRIQEEFVDSGAAKGIVDAVREKSKPSIKAEDLPF